MSDIGVHPEVLHSGIMDMQVCVPTDYTDEQIIRFAEHRIPCGTKVGWVIRKNLQGDPVRHPCVDKEGYVHVALEA